MTAPIFSEQTRDAIRSAILDADSRWATFQLDDRLQDVGFSSNRTKSYLRAEETTEALDRFLMARNWIDRDSLLALVRLLEAALAIGDIASRHTNQLQNSLRSDGFKIRNGKVYRPSREDFA